MDRNKLKAMLKPVVKEILKECILEDGVISAIIRESMATAGRAPIVERQPRRVIKPVVEEEEDLLYEEQERPRSKDNRNKFQEAYSVYSLGDDEESDDYGDDLTANRRGMARASEETRQRLAETMRKKIGVDVFSGSDPMDEGRLDDGSPVSAAKKGPLSDVDPSDPGVDLGLITEIAGGRRNWKSSYEAFEGAESPFLKRM